MKTVAVHADDFGLSIGTNEAIATLLATESIQSASVMANGPAFDDAAQRVADSSGTWSLGLHANLTQATPVGSGAGLDAIRDTKGGFGGRNLLWKACRASRVTVESLAAEVEAQWSRLVGAGIEPAHIDTHQHAHAMPLVQQAVWTVARHHRVPVRLLRLSARTGSLVRKAKSMALSGLASRGERLASVRPTGSVELLSTFQGRGLPSLAGYRALLEDARSDFVELMVHPAKVDATHRSLTDISAVSAADFTTLSSDAWKNYLAQSGYRFVPVHELLRQVGLP